MNKPPISLDRFKELLSYDQETGVIRWKVGRGNQLKAGDEAGRVGLGYRLVRIDGRGYMAHRLAWLDVYGKWPDGDIDHINGNGLDNRICNLRDVSRTVNKENMRTARVDNKVGLLGVYKRNRRRPYVASIRVNGKLKTIGSFFTAEEAHQAYLNEKRRLHAGCTI